MWGSESTRRRILYGAGIGGAGLIAGCCDSTGTDGGDTGDTDGLNESADIDEHSSGGEVHFLTDYYTAAWESLWGDLESEFQNETDIQLTIEESGTSGTGVKRLVQLIQAGTPPGANTSTFDQVAGVWEAGKLETVTDIVSSIEGVNGELNAGGAFLGEEDELYQIPHGLTVSNFQYRADVYEALGLKEPEI
ncbi:hypothetical protein [Natrinema marinum]|uniref:hypothetical protein n=1 Tax=Natrinema marinum TaxID=2961598 RepID=UPI0020C901BC|nr:hypothetical protein [Natrinema marinum]